MKYWGTKFNTLANTIKQASVLNLAPKQKRRNHMFIEYKRNEYVRYEHRHKLAIEDLSPDQRQFLMNLNSKLADIEQGIKKECQVLNAELERKLNDPNDWLEDYEIECNVQFMIKEDDLDYDEDSDNILVELSDHIKHQDWSWGMGDGNNHNDMEGWENCPMSNEQHCSMYHALYDHTDLGWVNMLRIGSLWIDIEVVYQKSYEIDF
jgi:hypothetical protein